MRRLFFLLLRLTGVPCVLRELVQRNKVAVLCYHDPDPTVFERHLRFLQRRYSIISLKRYVDALTAQDQHPPLPPKSLVITIDDGHRGNHALRDVVQRMRVPVTVFLCSAIVGTRRHFWWLHSPRKDANSYKQLVRRCLHESDAQRLELLAGTGFDETKEYSDAHALTSEQILELKDLVDFQSHGRLHPVLPNCSEARCRDEIFNSRTELRARFGLDAYAFAYPNGSYTSRELELVRAAAYRCGLTTDGVSNTLRTDPFRIARLGIYDHADLNELEVKACGLWGSLHKLAGGKLRPYS